MSEAEANETVRSEAKYSDVHEPAAEGRRAVKAQSTAPPPKRAARAIGRRPRMSRFLRMLVAITAAVHVPFAIGVSEEARRLGWPHAPFLGPALSVLGVLFFLGRARSGMYDKKKSRAVVLAVDIPYFIHWCACVFTIVPALVATLLSPLVDLARGAPIDWPARFYFWTYVTGLVVCGYGILVRRRWFRVREIDVAVAGLDPRLDGYRIAQLSDLHIGTTTPRAWGERWARAANATHPDLVVVTGDLVTSGTAFYDDVAGIIGGLCAKDGVFVSMGNHDYFGDGEPLVAAIQAQGARVLRNEGLTIDRSGAKLFLAAIDDTWTKRDDMNKALASRPKETPTVLLAHDPERFREAVQHDVDLVLSGHTHGGQIAVPFLSERLSLAHLTHHYHVGIYKKGRSTLYVHPGLGTTGPPMRLGVAPAVVVLRLRAA
jgi:predicted MPP superfamily phosphohydrolase